MLPRVAMEARAAADPELRFSPAGMAVCSLRLVCSDRVKDPDSGEWKDGRTLWLDATCFRALAENVVESVVKGDLLTVTGKLQTDEWEDRETGAKRSKVTLLADTVAVSLAFRTVKHGEGQAQRTQGQSGQQGHAGQAGHAGSQRPPADDPWATGPSSGSADDPPF